MTGASVLAGGLLQIAATSLSMSDAQAVLGDYVRNSRPYNSGIPCGGTIIAESIKILGIGKPFDQPSLSAFQLFPVRSELHLLCREHYRVSNGETGYYQSAIIAKERFLVTNNPFNEWIVVETSETPKVENAPIVSQHKKIRLSRSSDSAREKANAFIGGNFIRLDSDGGTDPSAYYDISHNPISVHLWVSGQRFRIADGAYKITDAKLDETYLSSDRKRLVVRVPISSEDERMRYYFFRRGSGSTFRLTDSDSD